MYDVPYYWTRWSHASPASRRMAHIVSAPPLHIQDSASVLVGKAYSLPLSPSLSKKVVISRRYVYFHACFLLFLPLFAYNFTLVLIVIFPLSSLSIKIHFFFLLFHNFTPKDFGRLGWRGGRFPLSSPLANSVLHLAPG